MLLQHKLDFFPMMHRYAHEVLGQILLSGFTVGFIQLPKSEFANFPVRLVRLEQLKFRHLFTPLFQRIGCTGLYFGHCSFSESLQEAFDVGIGQ
jgi:hypothetical protein